MFIHVHPPHMVFWCILTHAHLWQPKKCCTLRRLWGLRGTMSSKGRAGVSCDMLWWWKLVENWAKYGRIDSWTRTKQVDWKLAEYDPNSDLPNLAWQSSTSGFPLRCTGPRDQNVEKKQRFIHPVFYISHMLHIQCFLSRHESLVQQILDYKSKEHIYTSTKEHNMDMVTRYWSSYHSFVPSTRPYQAPNHATRGCCWKPQPRPHRSHVGPTNGSVDGCKMMEFCRNSWAVTPELMDFLQSLPSIHSMNQWIFLFVTYMLYRKQRFFSPTFTGAYGASFRFSPKPVLSTERSFTPWLPNILRGHFTNSASRRGITRYLKSKKSTICFTIQDMGISVLIGEYSE
jgi:hypothetical protein